MGCQNCQHHKRLMGEFRNRYDKSLQRHENDDSRGHQTADDYHVEGHRDREKEGDKQYPLDTETRIA